MFEFSRAARRGMVVVVALLGASLAPAARAQSIDVSLNVRYNMAGDPLSGGTYELVAKSSHQGIYLLNVKLRNVNVPTGPLGPRGTVNEHDPAGFSIFAVTPLSGTTVNVAVAQDAVFPDLMVGEEESIFYGVGTIAGGEPQDSGLPFASLTNPAGIPWGVGHSAGDPAWAAAVLLAQGSLIPGLAPAFPTSGDLGNGRVFTAIGDVDTVGPFANVTLTLGNLFVREILSGLQGDFNDDDVVDAADYTVWRNNFGASTEAPINNNGNGMDGVDEGDYDVWRANYGSSLPGGGGLAGGGLAGGSQVPEPASAALLAGAAAVLFLRRKTRVLRYVRVS